MIRKSTLQEAVTSIRLYTCCQDNSIQRLFLKPFFC